MTFNPTEFHIWVKEYPMFFLWAGHRDVLFQQRISDSSEFSKYDLTSKAYIFMKRLGQDYRGFMLMDAKERDTIFEMEMKLIEEEKRNSENHGKG